MLYEDASCSACKPCKEPHLRSPQNCPRRFYKMAEVVQLDVEGEPLLKVKEILAHGRRGKGYQWLSVMEGVANQDTRRNGNLRRNL